MSKNIEQSALSNKRLIKLASIMDTAACQMNEWGASTLSINDIAQSVGLSRNALYYYFKDRMELITSCYERSIQVLTQDLDEAIQFSDVAEERISFLFRRKLLDSHPEQAVLSDLDLVPEPRKSEILAKHQVNIAKLESIIEQGIRTNELRQIDHEITAQLLLGLLNWGQLWKKWNAIDEKVVENTLDILLRGASTNRDFKFNCSLDVTKLLTKPVNLFDSDSLGEAKRLQILGEASLLFNQRGIGSTSVDDIADRLGVTKGSIYHYFDDKQSLVNACYQNAFRQYELLLETVKELDVSGIERIMTSIHLNSQAQVSLTPPLILQAGILNTPGDIPIRANKLDDTANSMLIDAVEDGSSRIDGTSSYLTAGFYFWIPKWIEDKPPRRNSQVVDIICQIASGGILQAG